MFEMNTLCTDGTP